MSRTGVGGVIVAAVLLLGAAGAAGAAPPKPNFWAERPTPAELVASWPTALKREPTAETAIRCKARADGALEACKIVLERPAGAGLGESLLAMAPRFRLNMGAAHGAVAGDDVYVLNSPPIKYDKEPGWLRKPTPSDLMGVWPKDASRGGKGTVNCLVSLQGALFGCSVFSEEPEGSHFGGAALALTPQLLMSPAVLDGKPVVAPVMIPFNFVLPAGGRLPASMTGGASLTLATMAWPQAPSYADVLAAYPAKAREAKLGGRATLNCELDRQGGVVHCSTLAEEPKHEGFADAARVLAKQFRAFPTGPDGKTIAGVRLQLPVVFDPATLEGGQPVIGKAEWAGLPSGEETNAAFGKLAVAGTTRVRLACTVQQGGSVSDCKVVTEDPAGQGVGQAALSLAPHFRLTTWTAEGLPTVGGTINIPLRYEPGKAEPKG
jgi:TonB family protein